MQQTSTIMLVKPGSFGYNSETAVNNAFQELPHESGAAVAKAAVAEFSIFAERLQDKGVNVVVFVDTADPIKPDAVFPNNWISFHPDGTVVLYPMFAPSRRKERRADIIDQLKEKFEVKRVIDLSKYEEENRFLEGTGSIVFDHDTKLAFACLSPRTDAGLLKLVCKELGYNEVIFNSFDNGGMQIYHTNVMMCIANKFAVICMETIKNSNEKQLVTNKLKEGGHEIIEISFSQMNQFAGNMLAVNGEKGPVLVMSRSAYDSLTPYQVERLSNYCELLPMPIRTIETIGGGSARCMMAEVFLNPKQKE
jgi:hypothetical protein